MPIRYIRPSISGELRDPFDCDEQTVKALVTVGAFVALADGRVEAIERDEAVRYIDRRRLAPTISQERIAEFFDDRARRLRDRDFADVIVEALRPAAALSLTFDAVRIAEVVAAADQHVDPNEAQMIRLIQLMMTSPEPKGSRVLSFISGLERNGKSEMTPAHAMSADDWRLEQIINRLPRRVRPSIRFLRQPSGRWLRIPMGVLLTLGGVVGFLPIVGFWMLPIGLALLADDVQLLRSLRSRILDWVEHHRPHWLA